MLSRQFDPRTMTGCCSKMTVAREQRSVERFSKGDVNGVVGREIVPQVPDTRQKEVMRISVQGKVCQVGQSRTATVIIDFATRRIPPDHLRDFDIEQMRRVQRLRAMYGVFLTCFAVPTPLLLTF